ncbi:DUF2953 domain-containing protein [Alteribacillus iranensis]|uniref:DUF2953 domain-containing protein n=1 Tax=Alteribacillus iranensis TaxID=930128 RepID=A0A1I2CJE0_9BACI|nr:DUF2953 domain-containing protein [Alteribacillus iranensis]SFE67933.1 Protein of unknown function [Alteribacillus iranensis]
MEWVITTGLILICIVVMIMVTPVQLSFRLVRKNKRQDIMASLKIWYIYTKNFEIPIISYDEETPSLVIKEKTSSTLADTVEKDIEETPEDVKRQLNTLRLLVNHVSGLLKIGKRLLGKMKLEKLEWRSEIGTGDAAWAGILTGMLWSTKSMVAGVGSSCMKMKCSPALDVLPHFNKAIFNTEFKCIVAFKLGHAIIAGLSVLRQLNGSMFSLWRKARELNTNSKEAS